MSEVLRLLARHRALMAAVAVVWGLLMVVKGAPFLLDDRVITESTPTVLSEASAAPLELRPGAQACIDEVEYSPQTRIASVVSIADSQVSPPLTVTGAARGHRFRVSHPGGAERFTPVRVAIPPASRPVADGRLCVRNEGRRTATLAATGRSRSTSDSQTTVDGAPQDVDLGVTLLRDESSSVLSNAGTILDRLAAFRPGPGWAVGLLALLVLLGLPLAIAVALARAAADDDAPADDSA